jgi:hypothetical protein
VTTWIPDKIVKKNKKENKMTRPIIPTALGSAAIISIIVSIFNVAYASRPTHRDHHDAAPITQSANYDDGYVQGLEKLGIVTLPAHLRRPSSSPELSPEVPSRP